MSLRKLEFVEDVEMNLETTEGKIIFKEGSSIDIRKIARAVVQAGFSVRFLHAGFEFGQVDISNEGCYAFQGNVYQLADNPMQQLKGEHTLRFIGPEFLPKKELKSFDEKFKSNCSESQGKVYRVSL